MCLNIFYFHCFNLNFLHYIIKPLIQLFLIVWPRQHHAYIQLCNYYHCRLNIDYNIIFYVAFVELQRRYCNKHRQEERLNLSVQLYIYSIHG